MADYQQTAIYGDATGNGTLTATDLNQDALHSQDWSTVLTNGITGAVVNGINGAIGNAVQAGQLQNYQTATTIQTPLHKFDLIVIAVVAYLFLAKK